MGVPVCLSQLQLGLRELSVPKLHAVNTDCNVKSSFDCGAAATGSTFDRDSASETRTATRRDE